VSAAVALRRAAAAPLRAPRSVAGEQALVAGGQLASGLGNLVFAAAMARLLAPAGFAQLASFLALFLLIAVPSLGLSAGGALAPELAPGRRGRVLRLTLAASLALAAAALPLASSLGLSPATALALAPTPLLVGLVELERGRLYGERAYGRVSASLVGEPLLRLAVGTGLAASLGAPGAAAGVLAGSLGALAIARAGHGPGAVAAAERLRSGARRRGTASRAAMLGFLLLAVVQCQDVVFANATLGGAEAARFAAISTLGGAAVFATATIPFVLMPRTREGDPAALRAALGFAAGLGGAAALLAWVGAGPVLELAYGGGRFDSVASLLGPYMLAMALLGVARVLAANALVHGTRAVPWLLAGAAALQLGLLALLGGTVAGLAASTLAATAVLTASLLVLHVVTRPAPRAQPAPAAPLNLDLPRAAPDRRDARRTVLLLAAMTLVGLGLRLAASRSLWLDEATTWFEAELPFGRMLEVLRTTDVHPPLYFSVLWGTVRTLGDGQLALRLPSVLEGTALIPMLFVAGRALYDRRTGLLAAALGTLAPIAVWYSDEARMYAQLMLLALIAVWALHQAIETDRARYWAPYSLAAAAMVWTHYFSLLPLAVFEGWIAVCAWQRLRGPRSARGLIVGGALASLAILALTAPLMPFAHEQFMANQAAGKGFNQPSAAGAAEPEVSLYAALTNGVWALWGYHSEATMANLTALWPLLMLGALLFLGRGRSRASSLLLAGVLVPTVLLSALAAGKPFLFELRYDITAVPFLLLLGARAIASWPHARSGRVALAGLAVASLAVGLADQQLNGANPRDYDFEGALSQVGGRAAPGDVLLYQPPYLNNVISYYAPAGVEARRLDAGLPGSSPRHVFLLESFLEDRGNATAIRAAIQRLSRTRQLVDRFSVPQVRVWEFR
jgi:hypothetical protein